MATKETVFSPIALMLDAETLALTPNAFVTQVGLCVANTITREYRLEPINFWITNTGQEKRVIDIETVRFWMQQDREVAAGVFNSPVDKRVTPKELFDYLQSLCSGIDGITVWASPSVFDLPLLQSLFGGVKPWSYRAERDMVTLYKLLDPEGTWQPEENLKAHDAAADAKWQMEYLFNLLALLRDNNMLQDGM